MNLSLANNPLDKILQESVFSTPAVSIRVEDTLAEAAILLPHHLESMTDSLVVTKNDEPVGIVGGIEVLDNVLKKSSPRFLDNTKIGDVMSEKLVIIDSKNTLSELVRQWSQTRRAFAIIPNQYHGYSVISARKILEAGINFKIDTTVASIPKKKTITFRKDDTIKQILIRMFDNKTRKLVLENTKSFLNDRIIIEKLTREFNCLRNGGDFLNARADIFDLEQAKTIPYDLSISEACKIMYDMKSPYLTVDDRVISPWDVVVILSSENLSQTD